MDVKSLAKSLGITQQHVISKSNELIRLLKLKQPGSLGQGEICRPAVCLELACQTTPGCRLPSRDEFIRFSCSPPKVYNEMFTRIQRLLDVRPALDLRELVTIFGCVQLQSAVEQLLRAYKARFLASLPAEERARADLTRPAFLAAAFLLAAKKRKAKVDRAALTTKMGLTRGELDGALKDVAARCADMLQPPQQLGEGGEGAGRKRGRGDVAGAEQEAADEPAEAPRAAGGRGGAAKRPRRGAAARGEPEVEEDEAVAAAAANDVAVEDLRLVLCGIRPAQAPAAAGDEDEGADVPAERLKDRKKSKKAKKGSRAECGDGGDEGAALADEEEVAEVVAVAAAVAKKGKSKKSRRPQGGEQDEGRGEVEGLVAGGV